MPIVFKYYVAVFIAFRMITQKTVSKTKKMCPITIENGELK